MKSTAATWVSAAGSLVLAACTTPNIHKTDIFDPPTSGIRMLSIDAKQRVVIVGRSINGQTVTCAEPSPDALSALSTSVGGSIQDPKVAASFAVAQVESAASIGLRTTSIQLLRDGMYRLCEGYAAGGTKPDEFNSQQRRFQNLMLSLLAIEQLTGTVAARQAALGEGSAASSVGDNADEAAVNATSTSNAVADADKAVKKAQDTQTANATACKAANSDPTDKSCSSATDDKAAVASKQSDLDTAKRKEDTAKQALQAARSAVKAAATGAHVSFSEPAQTSQVTDISTRYVAEAIRTIVSTTLIASFAQEECANVWTFLRELPTEDRRHFLLEADQVPLGGPTNQSELVHWIKNCQATSSKLIQQAALFTPQYGSAPAATVAATKDPAAPTGVTSQATAGGKITVSFTPSEDDGGGAVTYVATATTIKARGTPISRSANGGATQIVLPGCADGDSYTIAVVAKRGEKASEPAKAPDPVKCTRTGN
jgi:hypothetical protein